MSTLVSQNSPKKHTLKTGGNTTMNRTKKQRPTPPKLPYTVRRKLPVPTGSAHEHRCCRSLEKGRICVSFPEICQKNAQHFNVFCRDLASLFFARASTLAEHGALTSACLLLSLVCGEGPDTPMRLLCQSKALFRNQKAKESRCTRLLHPESFLFCKKADLTKSAVDSIL